jgi:hypothetical protein
MINVFLLITMHAAVVGVLACLVSESNIAAPIRDGIERLPRSWFTRKLTDLVFCPICMAFWIALPTLTDGVLFYFTTVAMSNLWMLVILKVYRELDEAAEE